LLRDDSAKLDPDKAGLLEKAYGYLRTNSPSPQKASLGCQAFIHAAYSAEGGRYQIHDTTGGLSWAWHRAYLYFHERLLQWVIEKKLGERNAKDFRVPYWRPASDFGIYSKGNLSQGRTSTGAPPPLSAECLTDKDLDAAATVTWTWHDMVHDWLQGDIHGMTTCGLDPMFYAFHSYVDGIWESSAVKGKLQIGDTLAVFYDAYSDDSSSDKNAGWVLVNLKDFAQADRLGYRYEPFSKASLKSK
jgi:hypothetical protein